MAEDQELVSAYVRGVLVGPGPAEGGILRPSVPGSLVGAGDLQTCLARLTQRNAEARTHVARALQEHSAELGSVLAHAYQHALAVDSMERQLRGLALGVAEGPCAPLGLPDAAVDGACAPDLYGLGPEGDLESKARAARGAAAAVREQQQLVSALQCVAGIQQALRHAGAREATGDLEGAARTVAKLRERLLQVEGQWGEEHTAGQNLLHGLLALVTERASQLVDSFDAVLGRLCIADGAATTLTLRSKPAEAPGSAMEPVAACDLRTIMDSLEVLLGGQGPAWSRVAEAVLSSVLTPFLKQPLQEVVVEEDSTQDTQCSTSGWPMLRLRLAPSQAAGLSAEQVIVEHLYPKLGFLLDNLKAFLDRACSAGAFAAVWKLMWPRVAENIISLHLSKVVPVDLKQLESVGLVQRCTEQFEAALRAKGILEPVESQEEAGRPAEDNGHERALKGDILMQFVADVDVHFAAKKRVRVLAQVRRLLLSSGDFTSSLVTLEPDMRILKHKGLAVPEIQASAEGLMSSSKGEAVGPSDTSVLQWEPCHVTHAAQDVLSVVQETLLEACASTERTAPEMYRAAREAVVLFKALSASHGRGKAWQDVPQLAMLVHNDFLFMGHCLLTLAYQLRHRLPGGIRASAMFVDMVPFLWEQAATVSEGILRKQHRQLMEALDGAHRFAHADQEEGYSVAMKALKMVLYQLSQVTSVLRPVMAPSAFAKFLLSLINSVLKRCCMDILSHQDVSVDETEHEPVLRLLCTLGLQLRKVFLGLLERIPTVLEEPTGSSHSAEAEARSKEHKEACRQMLSFRKLQRLTDILDMSLVAITQAWRTGDLAANGFTVEEVHHLIRAIFSDTPLRRECLAQIAPS